MDIADQQQVKATQGGSPVSEDRPVTAWNVDADPFDQATPVADLSTLVGGLPDPRDADEILQDLARCRMSRARR